MADILLNEKKKAFIIGDPVGHSLSPKLHTYWLRQYGISGSYEAVNTPADYLVKTVKKMPERGFVGGNVTIPHKEKVLMLCDSVDQLATAVGAVNTLVFKDGKTYGYNTDVYGFTENLKTGGADFGIIKSALVLGAGGAARAVIIGLMKNNVRVAIANRSFDKTEKLANEFGCEILNWDEKEKFLGEFQLLINTTSLGMKAQPEMEIDLSNLPPNAVVNDIVYNPLHTGLLLQARDKGLKTVDGLGMLLYQAVAGFEMWFGQKPEVTPELREYIIQCMVPKLPGH